MATEIAFGPGRIAELGRLAGGIAEHWLAVTGRSSARESGLLDQVRRQLRNVTVFEGVEENPATDTCDRAAELCRECGCDGIVALGGGSPMDAAKAVAVLARNGGRCGDYFGAEQYRKTPLPLVAIPTTAGTGSEATPYAVIVDAESRSKKTIKGAALFPRVALLDPDLTVMLPREVTIHTGLDALSQAMEGLASNSATPMSDVLALEAIRLVKQWLPLAADEPDNISARGGMLYAACLSGCVIAQTGTTVVHGMGYYYTLQHGIAHGLANGLLLAPLFRHNAAQLPEKVAAMAGALGVHCEAAPESAAAAITEALHGLFETLGVDPAAKAHGVAESRLAEYARDCASDPYRFRNQPGALTAADVQRFFEESFAGR